MRMLTAPVCCISCLIGVLVDAVVVLLSPPEARASDRDHAPRNPPSYNPKR